MSRRAAVSIWFNALPGPLRGGVWMVLAAFSLSLMAASVRILSTDMHTFEIIFFRTMLGLPFMAPWLIRTRLRGLRTGKLRWLALRGVVTMVATTCFFWGLKMVPLADATAMMFTRPIFAAILAALFLHETVRGRRWTAMAAGFAGMLIMLRPGLADLDIGVVLVLIAALFAGGTANLLRYLARTESPDTITIYYSLFMTVASLVPAIIVWVTPDWEQAGWVLFMGFTGTLGQRAFARAFAAADVSVVLPFDYLRLPIAAFLGIVLFAQQPVVWTWVGGTVIFASTIYLARREAESRAGPG